MRGIIDVTPHRNRIGRNRGRDRRIVSARTRVDRERNARELVGQPVGVGPRRERGEQTRNVGRGRALVDRHEHDAVEELPFIHIDVVVDPALLGRAVAERAVGLTQVGELLDDLIGGGRRGKLVVHPRPVVRVGPAVGVVEQILFGSVENAGNAAARQNVGQRLMQPGLVVV